MPFALVLVGEGGHRNCIYFWGRKAACEEAFRTYEGSTEERNGEAVEGRGSIVKYWETAFAESNENLSEYLGYG